MTTLRQAAVSKIVARYSWSAILPAVLHAMDAPDRLERLFHAAQLLPPEERQAFLRSACGDDEALLRELESLLHADVEAEKASFLGNPAARALDGSTPDEHVADLDDQHVPGDQDHDSDRLRVDDPLVGKTVGPYTIRRPLGSGGMGDVYLALQERPFKRYVAVKLIRPGLDTREILRRFDAERQILASLSHPNIARLLDGGITSDGLPYFAMEYVEGMPLITYCDTHRLGILERLRLFQTVCQTVHHAHQNLVLHRDLKPSNILVTKDGTVKLLDFGVARLLNPHLSHVAMPDTRTDARMMTPEYASPEQVRGLTLTTASDVYSLGVVLYELLTGRRPHRLTGSSTDEIVRIVCYEEPSRPSKRVNDSAPDEEKDAEAIATARGMTQERLARSLRGDIDNIAMMALRKEPGRRYASAEQLAEDVERHLQGQPVTARPSTWIYRARKFTARHRASVAAAALVVLSLIGGLGTAIRMANVARQERIAARQAESQARTVSELLIGLFESSDPWLRPTDARWANALMARGIDRANDLNEDPIVQARFLDAIGRVYENLGQYEQAQTVLERALDIRRSVLGEEDPGLADVMNHLGWVQYRRGRYSEAEGLYRRALDIQLRTFGEEHPALAETYVNLGYLPHSKLDTSIAYFRRALQVRLEALGPDHPDVAHAMSTLASMLSRKGRHDEAEQLLRRAVELRRRSPDSNVAALAKSYFMLADELARRPESAGEAEQLYRAGLSVVEHRFGQDHLGRAHGLSNLANLLDEQRRFEEAEVLYRESLALRTNIFGEEHAMVQEAKSHLATHLHRRGHLAEAESLHRDALSHFKRLFGPRHRSVAWSLGALGDVLIDRGRLDEAEARFREALSIREEVGGSEDLAVAEALRSLAHVLYLKGSYADCEELRLKALAVLTKQLPEEHELVQATYGELVTLYSSWQRPDRADEYRRLMSPPTEGAAATQTVSGLP